MENATTADAAKSIFQSVAIERIIPSRHQARKQFDEDSIKALAESMKQEGLLQPITVRQVGDGYELIGGERRVRAAKFLGWPAIDAKVIQTGSEAEAAAKGLVENLQRNDLNPVEEAQGFAELNGLDSGYWTHEKIAEVAGKARTYVTESISLIGLPKTILDNVCRQTLSRSLGVELTRLSSPELQFEAAKRIEGLNRQEARRVLELFREKRNKKTKHEPEAVPQDLPADPMSDIWSKLLGNPAISAPLSWQVSYGHQKTETGVAMNGWSFIVTIPGVVPKAELAAWFKNMANALGDAVKD